MTFRWGVIASATAVLLFGCSGADDDSGDGLEEGWETLIEATWEVAPGENNFCMKKTFDEEVVISAFEAIAPPGTHHTVVTVGDPNGADGGPDGFTECGSYVHHFEAWIFESNMKKDRFELPPGLAARILPGQQVNLNFHIMNTTDETLTGTTGTAILRADPATVEDYATAIFMGKVSLSVPPGESTHTGQCDSPADLNVIAVQPHMHSHATHQKVVAHSTEMGDQVLLDTPFDFYEDMYFRMVAPEVPLAMGDTVDVSCSYNNDTGENLPWGDSSWEAEMCFAVVYVYPAGNLPSAACAN